MTYPLSSADISIFSLEIIKFCYIKKYRLDCVLLHNLSFLKLFWVFKDCFNKHGYNFDGVSKMAILSLLKINVFWKVITSVHDITNKILLSESNYIVDVIMWPKFGNSGISCDKL